MFAHDRLPLKINTSQINFGVINYHKFTQPGSHWVCYFYHPDEKYIEFFDSYGLSPSNRIKTFLKTSGKSIVYNSSKIQSFQSQRCGWYCIYFILGRLRGVKFYDLIMKFTADGSFVNDKRLIQMLY